MNFRKLNNIFGWVIFIAASLVYILTMEKRGSFWDCGEFVSACYKVQLPHPPGAPLFVLLGRFFIILFGDDPMTAARAVNFMNAVASGATILFLFWTITHFARKLMVGLRDEPTIQQSLTIIGAGLVGGLAYTFTDSFWFSAVEGEVYALSSLFTALAFWAILKWERADDAAGNDIQLRNRADRWIVFLFFTLGLSIGIHLLGLLVIPAAVMVYYYKRYPYTRKGAIWAFIIGCVITGIVQVVVIQWSVKAAGWFDIRFVNNFGLPFFSGFTFFFILMAILVWLGLRWANKNNWHFLRLGLWCFGFIMMGYSTYITTMERSNANPA
ncbi:MAG: glycosyltransferase family 117 protein, partial [Flavisolibacter sp.]